MVIGLLAPFRRVLLTRGCQQDPCFEGDFLRVGLPLRPAKSLQGFVGWLTYAACHTGKWLKSRTVRLSVLSAISPPCSDLATMVLGQPSAGLVRAHLQPRPFSTAGHDLDHEHNLLIELNSRGVMGNLGRPRPDHPAVDASRVFVKRKPHPDDVYRERLVHPRRVPTVYYLPHPTLLPSRKDLVH